MRVSADVIKEGQATSVGGTNSARTAVWCASLSIAPAEQILKNTAALSNVDASITSYVRRREKKKDKRALPYLTYNTCASRSSFVSSPHRELKAVLTV